MKALDFALGRTGRVPKRGQKPWFNQQKPWFSSGNDSHCFAVSSEFFKEMGDSGFTIENLQEITGYQPIGVQRMWWF
jgi:hypothetical protein